MTSTGNLSLQYMNSNICTLRFGLGVNGSLFKGGASRMHNILGVSRARHLHIGR